PEESVDVLSVDVDQLPAKVTGFERRTSYAVVVGIGNYRDPGVPGVKYAKRDAEVVAKYLSSVAGFPAENIRLLTDEHALAADLNKTFENWLPQKAHSSGILFVYLVGNAVSTDAGAPALLPYEGAAANGASGGYSIKHLEEVLNRLPSRLKLIFADLSFPPPKPSAEESPKRLVWLDAKLQTKGRIVVVASSPVASASVSSEATQHGLFTYQFLRALRGHGDANADGWVDLGEVLNYMRSRLSAAAAPLPAMELAVVPDVDLDGPVGSFPLAKIRQ
ncbi:MAG TPA: caspase family protein, partial [Terriglobales bacterium]|nr:caspase family protein [Terriglobales bacterium]